MLQGSKRRSKNLSKWGNTFHADKLYIKATLHLPVQAKAPPLFPSSIFRLPVFSGTFSLKMLLSTIGDYLAIIWVRESSPVMCIVVIVQPGV